MTAVLCCYASLHPATRRALTEHAPGAEFTDVTGDPFAYWREIAARWNGTADLVTVEQDIEIHASVLAAFQACPRLWCTYPYEIHQRGTWLDFGLGCTRFRAQAQRLVSTGAIEDKPGTCETCDGVPGCWRHLDCKVYWAMTEAGIERCVHSPAVTHHSIPGDPADTAAWHRIAPLGVS